MFAQGALFVRDCTPKWKKICPVGKVLSPDDRFSAHLLLSEPEKTTNLGIFWPFQDWPGTCNNPEVSGHREGSARCIRLIPRVVSRTKFQWYAHFSGEGGSMYLLFGPSMAAVIFIAVIQLRDHFAPSR